eukprot:5704091-Amphidinium_carterae.3
MSSTSTATTTSTTTTVTWMVVAGSYRFYAAGVEVSAVRSTCTSIVANVTSVSEERLECAVSVLEDLELRLLQLQSESVQTFIVSFIISVQQEQEASVRADLEAIEADNATSFAVLVEEALLSVVENATLLEQSFQFRQYDLAVIENAMDMFLLEVARQEARALSALLDSNKSHVVLDLGDGSVAVAAKLSANESQAVQVSEAVTVTVPVELFDEVGEEELALVVVVLADSVVALTQSAADDTAEQDDVEASITITIYTGEGVASGKEVLCLAANEVLNEVLGSICDHCDMLCQLGVGIVDLLQSGSEEDSDASDGRLAMLLATAARGAMKRTAHLNTCARTGLHYDDEYEEHLDQFAKGASFSKDSPSGSIRSPSDNNMSGPPGIDDRTLSRAASTVSSHAANAEEKLKNIHRQYTTTIEIEHQRLHRVGHIARNTLRQFLHHGPIGSVFSFSITMSSGIRALLLACETMGSFFVATLFMQASNKSRSINSPSECSSTDDDAASAAGRFVALGLASSVLAVFPVLILSKLHFRKVVSVDYVGSKAWKRQLQSWQFLDACVWCLGITYTGFCTMYVMLFFANTIQADHSAWLMSAITAAITDFIIAPMAGILIPPLTVVFLLLLLSTIVRKPRKEVVKLVRGNSQIDPANRPEAERNPADMAQDADSSYSVPMEHDDDEGVITVQSQQTGCIQTVLVLPAPVTEADDASSSCSSVLGIDAFHFDA